MDNLLKYQTTLIALVILFIITSCGGGNKFVKSPVDIMIRDMPSDQVFTIILQDMDVRGNFFETFHHKYKVITAKSGKDVNEVETEWFEVGKNEFNRHVNDMGMEIAARDSTGHLSKTAVPPGYTNYVGNPRYGRWSTSGGSSFWQFYGQYHFMNSMFRMAAYPAYRNHYSTWRGSYYGTNRSYYGGSTGGGSYYGTNSKYNRTSGRSSAWSRNRSSFKQNVASRTSRSSTSSGGFRSRGSSFGK